MVETRDYINEEPDRHVPVGGRGESFRDPHEQGRHPTARYATARPTCVGAGVLA